MCGLTLAITPVTHLTQEIPVVRSLHATNAARGPNAHGIYARRVNTGAGDVLLTLASSVLGLRGPSVTAQPLVGQRGVLGWNGQAFSGIDVSVDENDTVKIFERLEAGDDPDAIFASVEGPWAFVYFCFTTNKLTFGVDPLSRRSLLLHLPAANSQCRSFILSSTRSAAARKQGLGMRALDGGQIGTIHFARLSATDDLNLVWSSALQIDTTIAAHVAPVNKRAPSAMQALKDMPLQAVIAECPRFLVELTASVRRRVENIPAVPAPAARVALLFSGGVDCSLLACLVHRCLPATDVIELVNVAFEQSERRSGLPATTLQTAYDVPDRLSGKEAVMELREACPGRHFRFIEVNVSREESLSCRQVVIDTMYPSLTEMDLLSLAYPLFFASLGKGVVNEDAIRSPYRVSAKVFLSGLGADEQLAGYTRHRKAFERRSWSGLCDEIQLDLDRLPNRNLSRDDRMLSAHARDARYPFLDLRFVAYLSNLSAWKKCNLALPPGEGDKALVRQAALQCGLRNTSKRVKRAMQFGTKSAKLYQGPAKGFRAGEKNIDTYGEL